MLPYRVVNKISFAPRYRRIPCSLPWITKKWSSSAVVARTPVYKPWENTSDYSILHHSQISVIKRDPAPAQEELLSMASMQDPLVWIDLETSGLDFKTDRILEVACIITNGTVTKSIKGPNLVIHREEELLNNMNEWCKRQHWKTGLVSEVQHSKLSVTDAEEILLDFVCKHVPNAKTALLAGSSVHFDKEFLREEMPTLYNHLHYRIVDVSSIGEMVKRLYPSLLRRRPRKQGDHRAMADIEDSIRELQFYRDHALRYKE